MTDGEVRDWIKANLTPKSWEFGLNHWEIFVEYGHLDDARADIQCHFQYERAYIRIDPACYENDGPDRLERTLEHEFCHILLSPLNLSWSAAKSVLSDSKFAMFADGWEKAEELAVSQIERSLKAIRAHERTPKETDATTPPQ